MLHNHGSSSLVVCRRDICANLDKIELFAYKKPCFPIQPFESRPFGLPSDHRFRSKEGKTFYERQKEKTRVYSN